MRRLLLISAAMLLAAPGAQAQDAAAGEKVFAQCRACHQIGPTARNLVGPKLRNDILNCPWTAVARKISADTSRYAASTARATTGVMNPDKASPVISNVMPVTSSTE